MAPAGPLEMFAMKTASFSSVSCFDYFLVVIVPRMTTKCSSLSLAAPMKVSGDLRRPKANHSLVAWASSMSSVNGRAAT